MKKILSIFAFVAMLCIPFSFVSCGDDDDPVVPTPTPSQGKEYYSYSGSCGVNDVETTAKIFKFLQEKLGSDVNAESAQYFGIIIATNREKGDAAIKGLAKYEDELNNLLKDNGVTHFEFTISHNTDVLYTFKYTAGRTSYAGTYTCTDSNGAVWTVTLTDEDAGDDYCTGSVDVPTETNGVKAGLYKGKYHSSGNALAFRSEMTQDGSTPVVRATLHFTADSEDGEMHVLTNGKTVFSKLAFQKKK